MAHKNSHSFGVKKLPTLKDLVLKILKEGEKMDFLKPLAKREVIASDLLYLYHPQSKEYGYAIEVDHDSFRPVRYDDKKPMIKRRFIPRIFFAQGLGDRRV